LQCHKSEDYDTRNHHFHKLKGEPGNAFVNKRGEKLEPGAGTLCRDCHMAGQYYMGVDKRYDHSFRIPRPDLSISLGTPNACVNCHDDKTNQWALQWVNKWYGENKKVHYGTMLAEASARKEGADQGLLKIINSNLYPEIIRATAISLLSAYQNSASLEAIQKALNDPDALLRHTAVQNFQALDSATLFSKIAPLLNDPIKSVRMEAANRLMSFPKKTFQEAQYQAFKKALDEYRKSLEYVADFQTGRYNLGNFYSKLKDLPRAESNFREAIAIDNLFFPAKINLAMIDYQQGKLNQAEVIFNDLVTNHPDVIEGYYYLALLYGEQQKYSEAIKLLETASNKPACYSRVFYNLGLLYQMMNQNDKCESTLKRGLAVDPENFDILYALFAFHMKQNNKAKATPYMEQLRRLYPDNRQVQDWYNSFKQL
jgi:tetratricopeptide (TPR) repeat protein